MNGVALIWLAAFATVCNPISVDPASRMVREAVWKQTKPLFANHLPESRREAIRRAQLFGLAEAYPELVREAFVENRAHRQAALEAIRGIRTRYQPDIVLPGDVRDEAQSTRADAVSDLSDRSGASELFALANYAEDTLSALYVPYAERQTYLRNLIEGLGEDVDYGPEDVPGGCGFGMGGGPEPALKFLWNRSRADFIVASRAYLADPKANCRGRLIDLLYQLEITRNFESVLRPLLDHPRTAIRVPATSAMSALLSVSELKKRMVEDPSGAVRVVAFWALAAHDDEMALKLALPRLEKMVPDERFQVLARLYDVPGGRKRLEALAHHRDKTVANGVRALLREIRDQERDVIRP